MAASRAIERLHVVVGFLVCVALPGASYLDGSGRLAYAMFSATRMYKLEVIATDAEGRAQIVAPALLGQAAGGSAALFFAGADHFRRGPVTLMPRAHLDDIAALACRVAGATSIDVALLERESEDAPVRRASVRRTCNR